MNQRCLPLACLIFLAAPLWGADPAQPTLSYLGRATLKIVSASGFTVYVDPYGSGDYSAPADLVLVTHGHSDHNAVEKLTLKPQTVLAGPKYAIAHKGARVVAAYNKNHPRNTSRAYLISVDGITVYHAGDTNFIPEMAGLADARIDYAFFPVDGYYNMDAAEAMRCVEAVKPRFALAFHASPSGDYDAARAAAFKPANALAIAPGQVLKLAAAGPVP